MRDKATKIFAEIYLLDYQKRCLIENEQNINMNKWKL